MKVLKLIFIFFCFSFTSVVFSQGNPKKVYDKDIVLDSTQIMHQLHIENQESTVDTLKDDVPMPTEPFMGKEQSPTTEFKIDPSLEIIELRDLNTKHYKNEDGKSIDAIISPVPVHYFNAENELVDIDLNIVSSSKSGYQYQNITNNLKTYFPSASTNGIMVQTPLGDLFVGKGLKVNYTNHNGVQLSSNTLTTNSPSIDGEKIIYNTSNANIKNEYEVRSGRLKHNYILNQMPNMPSGAYSMDFSEQIKVPAGWRIDFSENAQELVIFDATGLPFLQIPFPEVYEKNDMAEDTLHYEFTSKFELNNLGNGVYEIITKVNAEWLSNKNYPVIVDPTIVLNGNTSGYIWRDYNRASSTIVGNVEVTTIIGVTGIMHTIIQMLRELQ